MVEAGARGPGEVHFRRLERKYLGAPTNAYDQPRIRTPELGYA